MSAEIAIETYAGKLNRTGHAAFVEAMRHARGEGHRHVDAAHWLHHIVCDRHSDLSTMLPRLNVDRGEVLRELTAALGVMDRGVTEYPVVSEMLGTMLNDAWIFATLRFGEVQIRSGHALVALLSRAESRRRLGRISPLLATLSADRIAAEATTLWRESAEEAMRPMDGMGLGNGEAMPRDAAAPGRDTPLARFARDLTAAAADMDPIVGRDNEIRQLVDVLLRRRQNNPILTGEAGVGKTAVVEGFARLLASDEVPARLQGTKLYELDIQAMQAGASMKGEFEQRLKGLIEQVQSAPEPIILFIDEAHTLVGAGGQAGLGDAANLLKPALARGTLRTIGATTWAEYRAHFEKDPALARRFQAVAVDEPDIDTCTDMLRAVLKPLEVHHGVGVSDGAVCAAVRLSARYLPERQLPDKAVSLLDTACARVAVGQFSTPAAIQDLDARISALDAMIAARQSAAMLGEAASGTTDDPQAARAQALTERDSLHERHMREREIVTEILTLRAQCASDEDDLDARARLATLDEALAAVPVDERMIYPHVSEDAVAAVISSWTGIPAGRMVRDELQTLLSLSDRLRERVVGQDHALEAIARRVRNSRAGLGDPAKPVGVFMLCGPSGVGKTETGLALADMLYGGARDLITINMSEFQEAHSVSLLKGAPPGYVGHGEGGRLTEAVRRRPHCVLLLDEVEKAHPDVHELFFQVFDKGVMEDGTGRAVDFRNALILLTSNVGTAAIMDAAPRGEPAPDPEILSGVLRPAQLAMFPPALLGRIVSIPYLPLDDAALAGIARLKLDRITTRMADAHGAQLEINEDVVGAIVARCHQRESGGRMIDDIVTNDILPALSREILARMVSGIPFTRVLLTPAGDGSGFDSTFIDEETNL